MHLSYMQHSINVIFACILVTLVIFLDNVHGFSVKNVIDSPLLTQKIQTNRTIKVDANGQGDFKSVQAAIDSVPNGNSNWIIIHVTKGIYREKVHIPRNKPYIFMRGNGRGRTAIVWSENSENNYQSATFKVEAPYFVAFGISFKNDAPTGIAHTSQNQSVAALVGGDKAAFYHCGFFSSHNTLFDYKGRHYYDNCYIQGSIDFIFGRGQSIFHDCEIFVIANKRHEIRGSITANSRQSAKESSGFSLCQGEGLWHWTVIPQGWTNWSYPGSTDNLDQAEYKCHGPGSASTNRATWSKQLSDKEAAPFLSVDFIKGKEWLPAWL
ncbi:putative pectinesterase 67 [Abeliophyllum distichum]|uniref:Pectinesterase n=1 Tax=Abeliophyllum distichum TaxID=126358 RepID=A0ABD1VD03_9LAMI